MSLDGTGRDEQALADLRVGQALGDELHNSQLGRAEALPTAQRPLALSAAALGVGDRIIERGRGARGPRRCEGLLAECLAQRAELGFVAWLAHREAHAAHGGANAICRTEQPDRLLCVLQLADERRERLQHVRDATRVAGVMEGAQRLVQQILGCGDLAGAACELGLRLERGPDRQRVPALARDEHRFFDHGHGRRRLSAHQLRGRCDQQRADGAEGVVAGARRRQRLTHQRLRALELAGGVFQQSQIPLHQRRGVVGHAHAQGNRLLDVRPRGRPLPSADLGEAEEPEIDHRKQRVAERTRLRERLLQHRLCFCESTLQRRVETEPGERLTDAEQVACHTRNRKGVFEQRRPCLQPPAHRCKKAGSVEPIGQKPRIPERAGDGDALLEHGHGGLRLERDQRPPQQVERSTHRALVVHFTANRERLLGKAPRRLPVGSDRPDVAYSNQRLRPREPASTLPGER